LKLTANSGEKSMLWEHRMKNALKGRYTILQVTLLLAMILSLLLPERGHDSIPARLTLISQQKGTFQAMHHHLAEQEF